MGGSGERREQEEKGLESVLNIEKVLPEHPGWKNETKKENFFHSFETFYITDFIDIERDMMERRDVEHFLYVSNGFLAHGTTFSNVIEVMPYSNEEDFSGILKDVLEQNNHLAVFTTKYPYNTGRMVQHMVKRVSDKLYADYEDNLIKYSPEIAALREKMRNGGITPEMKEKRKKSLDDLHNILIMCHVPVMKLDEDDGTELISAWHALIRA